MNNFMFNFLTFGSRRPWITTCIFLVACVFAVAGALKVEVDTSYDRLISESDPGWPDYHKTVKEFGSDSTTIIYLRDANMFTPEKLALVDELGAKLKLVPGVERVESLFTVLSIRGVDGEITARPLMDIVPESIEDAAKVREDALYSPIIRRNLISPDGKTIALTVTVNREKRDPAYIREQFDSIESNLDLVRPKFERVFQVGPPRLNVDIQTGMIKDMALLIPLSTVLLMGTLIYFLRTWLASVVPLVTSGISILLTFGFMGFAGIPLTLLTALVPSLNIVIGSSEDTHLISAYLRRIGVQKTPDRREAINFMARHIGVAIFLTAVTTARVAIDSGQEGMKLRLGQPRCRRCILPAEG